MAPIRALESLTRPVAVRLHTDSKYVLDAAVHRHQVQWHWVKGHAGHPENERADQLAARGLNEACA